MEKVKVFRILPNPKEDFHWSLTVLLFLIVPDAQEDRPAQRVPAVKETPAVR